jgi:hypothetical protein
MFARRLWHTKAVAAGGRLKSRLGAGNDSDEATHMGRDRIDELQFETTYRKIGS